MLLLPRCNPDVIFLGDVSARAFPSVSKDSEFVDIFKQFRKAFEIGWKKELSLGQLISFHSHRPVEIGNRKPWYVVAGFGRTQSLFIVAPVRHSDQRR